MMNKISTFAAVAVLALVGAAAGSEIETLSWNQSNLERLRSIDKAAVARFLNGWSGNKVDPLPASGIREFEWIDLARDGKYEMVVITSPGPCCVDLAIYRQGAAGKVTAQILEGAGKLRETIRDLNGDGNYELVISTELAEKGSWMPMVATPAWPAVYRLEKGKYVEASQDFPSFYDTEVLPRLSQKISAAEARIAREPVQQQTIAVLEMERNKILRVIGRDPAAGLQQAYRWMNSKDPQVLQCAIATFSDIGGHERELREAQRALPVAIRNEMAARHGRS
jgi:hypothetical protein